MVNRMELQRETSMCRGYMEICRGCTQIMEHQMKNAMTTKLKLALWIIHDVGFRDRTRRGRIMEKQMEKNIEDGIEATTYRGYIGSLWTPRPSSKLSLLRLWGYQRM